LVYFGARWYDAAVGRFITPDPAAGAIGDPNAYLFARANPVNFVDRWGLHPEETEWVIDLDDETVGATGHVWVKAWAGDLTEMSVREVSRTAEKLVREYLWEHFHTYDILHWLCEYIEDEAGDRYWVVVEEERYVTDWVLVESYEHTEVIDLIAYKQDILVREAGFAPPPPPVTPWFDVGEGGGEWLLSAGVGFIPVAGEAKDVQEAITGVDLITGEKLSGWERALTVVCIFIPFVGGSAVRGALKGAEALAGAAKGSDEGFTLLVKAGSQSLELSSEHPLLRMAQRGVSVPQLEEVLGAQPFQFYHEGVWKTGYYDPVRRIFVSQYQGVIMTVITEAKPQYIENLLRARP